MGREKPWSEVHGARHFCECSRPIHKNHHTATQPAIRQGSSGNASTSAECFVKCEESITSTSGDDAIEQPQWMDLCSVCACF
jgi:hypothetical protein